MSVSGKIAIAASGGVLAWLLVWHPGHDEGWRIVAACVRDRSRAAHCREPALSHGCARRCRSVGPAPLLARPAGMAGAQPAVGRSRRGLRDETLAGTGSRRARCSCWSSTSRRMTTERGDEMRRSGFRRARSHVKATVGESVRILRELQELSQNELASRTGTPQYAFRHRERSGQPRPGACQVHRSRAQVSPCRARVPQLGCREGVRRLTNCSEPSGAEALSEQQESHDARK